MQEINKHSLVVAFKRRLTQSWLGQSTAISRLLMYERVLHACHLAIGYTLKVVTLCQMSNNNLIIKVASWHIAHFIATFNVTCSI